MPIKFFSKEATGTHGISCNYLMTSIMVISISSWLNQVLMYFFSSKMEMVASTYWNGMKNSHNLLPAGEVSRR